jgi:hypothetical protein
LYSQWSNTKTTENPLTNALPTKGGPGTKSDRQRGREAERKSTASAKKKERTQKEQRATSTQVTEVKDPKKAKI